MLFARSEAIRFKTRHICAPAMRSHRRNSARCFSLFKPRIAISPFADVSALYADCHSFLLQRTRSPFSSRQLLLRDLRWLQQHRYR
jgi:hypothetical protein